jgi:hypothetical protein
MAFIMKGFEEARPAPTDVQKVQIVQSPSFILPRDAGEERGGGFERCVAVKRLERFERERSDYIEE